MEKRTQNIVAESRFTLPVVMAYAIAVWLCSGLLIPAIPFSAAELAGGAWVQFACFLASAYLMVELNNGNALIRIYSRTVSCSFVVLLCAASFLFGSLSGAIVQLCAVAAWTAAFHTYQDESAAGWTFYAFLAVGTSSVAFVQSLCFVPLLWAMMYFQLSALSWRTFAASVAGLLAPYWLLLPLALWQGTPGAVIAHFAALATLPLPCDYSLLTVNEVLLYAFTVGLGTTGTVHYLRNKSADSIRIRQLYGCFILTWVATALLLALQPQHYDALVRVLIVNVSPLIAHFLSLTHTRATNIAFHAICALALLLTLLNLWMPSLRF